MSDTDFLEQIRTEYDPRFEALTAKALQAGEDLGKLSPEADEDRKALTSQIETLDAEVKTLTAERDAKLRQAEQKALSGRVQSLEQMLNEAREPHSNFTFGNGVPLGEDAKAYADRSFFADAARVDADPEARKRWEEAMGEGKAMTEGTGSTGGYLVPDQISGELLEIRQAQSVLRNLFSSIQVSSDTLRIATVTSGLTAGWVAELAEKPISDLAFGEISANVFQKAGMAVASNQLLKDANRSVDRLIYRDLAKRLVALEEAAFINGSGTGQPRGILNTTGVDTVAATSAGTPSERALVLYDAILAAIGQVYTDYFAPPSSIIMHPRTWAFLVSARNADGIFYLGGPGDSAGNGRRADESVPGFGSSPFYRGSLFGTPVYTTPHIPTNRGAGTNESCVIVGEFSEGLVLDREGITLDSSEHVYFTSNQTIFRAEDRVGFTAARYPDAFKVVGGTALAGV